MAGALVDFVVSIGALDTDAFSPTERLLSLLTNAKRQLHSGDVVGAEQSFRELSTLFPVNAPILATFGTVLAQQKKLTEALSCFKKALDLEPTKPLYHQAFGECLLRTGALLRGFAESESNHWTV